jgi:4-carboxymuconolactone decarboxylase
MSTVSERGEALLEKISPGSATRLHGLDDIAPGFAELAIGFSFGEIYAREGLDLKTRQLLSTACLAILPNARPQLKNHINVALNVGCTRREVAEAIIHSTIYAGIPAGLNALAAMREVFEARDAGTQKGAETSGK